MRQEARTLKDGNEDVAFGDGHLGHFLTESSVALLGEPHIPTIVWSQLGFDSQDLQLYNFVKRFEALATSHRDRRSDDDEDDTDDSRPNDCNYTYNNTQPCW